MWARIPTPNSATYENAGFRRNFVTHNSKTPRPINFKLSTRKVDHSCDTLSTFLSLNDRLSFPRHTFVLLLQYYLISRTTVQHTTLICMRRFTRFVLSPPCLCFDCLRFLPDRQTPSEIYCLSLLFVVQTSIQLYNVTCTVIYL